MADGHSGLQHEDMQERGSMMPKELVFHSKEFEEDVRNALGRRDGPITDEDVQGITEFICSDDYGYAVEVDILSLFVNLEELVIPENGDMSFLTHLPKLKDLYIIVFGQDGKVDFSAFAGLSNLEALTVSSYENSDLDYTNLESLTSLMKLKDITLAEFGSVDLKFLEKMPWIEQLYIGDGDEVKNIDRIGTLSQLQSLELSGLQVDNLDFLDKLSDTTDICLCEIEVHDGIDVSKFDRFRDFYMEMMSVGWHFIPVQIDRRSS